MRLFFQIILALVVFVWIVVGAAVLQSRRALGSSGASLSMTAAESLATDQHHDVLVGDVRVRALVADTNTLREKGLSGVERIADDEGMLFVFDQPDIHAFWMPDMNFSIDIIWVDVHKKIIGVSENAQPLIDGARPAYYHPSAPAQYVLEVPAGFFQKHGLKKGMQFSW